MIEFQVLGGVEVRVGGQALPARRPQQNAVLAALVMDAGRPVPVETLIDRVWGEAVPRHARRDLQIHLARIRQQLSHLSGTAEGVQLLRQGGGYLLDVETDRVDLHRFRRLVDQALDADCPDRKRLELLRQALGLWRGDALAGVPGEWAARVRDAWRHRYLDAVVAWGRAELAAGDPRSVIGPLGDLAGQYPLVEPLTAVLMRALAATGGTAQALDLYDRTRRVLAAELGTDPGPELRAAHQEILRGEVAVRQEAAPRVPVKAPVVPAQLPRDVHGFAGRSEQLARLDALLSDPATPAVVITAVSGMAGVGKTALAVHWAHQVADRFPDGQLYVNLHGFHPDGQPTTTADAIRGFLDALGVGTARIPAAPGAQVALYRSLIAGRRILIVLDNARDADQVRPLLPGSPAAMVVVTSRNQLTSLAAVDGAHVLPVDVLSNVEARQLLAARLGPDRLDAEPEAVRRIVAASARLPIAVTIVAARAAANPRFTLEDIARELDEARGSLDVFDGGDQAANVQAVFSWSYGALGADAARLFRLLGLHPGPDITAPAAASLACLTPARLRPLLGELARINLITEHAPGRYVLHDLLRAYATHLAHTTDPEDARQDATRRLLDHYLHTAYAADRLMHQGREPISLAPPHDGVTPEGITDRRHALRWFTAEHAVLLAAVTHADAAGFDTHAWQLAWSLATFLYWQGHWQDLAATGIIGVAAGQRLGDPTVRALAHREQARADVRLARFDDAHTQLRRALALYMEADDRTGQAHTHRIIAHLSLRQGDLQQALDHSRQAFELFRDAGHQIGRAQTLNNIGWCLAQLGEYQQALATCQEALALHQELNNGYGQATTWDSLGYVHHHLGHHAEAIDCYQHALPLYREAGDRYYEGNVFNELGDSHRAAGDLAAARDWYRQALDILGDLDHPDTDAVRAKLDALDAEASG